MQEEHNYYLAMKEKVFQDKNRIIWVGLIDCNYPRTALYLPEQYHKQAFCEAHDSIFRGHNTMLKTYLKVTSSYFWQKVY